MLVCHMEESTDLPECGAQWRELAPDVNDEVMMQFSEWYRNGCPPSDLRQRFVRFWSGSADYIIDLGALKQKRMDLTQGAMRRLKLVMPVTEPKILAGHELQFSVMHKPAKTHIQDCGALWIQYKPEVNSKVLDKFRQWVRQGAHSDGPGKSVNITVGRANYIVDFPAMTQTRITNDWVTNEESLGAPRKLRTDIHCAEG